MPFCPGGLYIIKRHALFSTYMYVGVTYCVCMSVASDASMNIAHICMNIACSRCTTSASNIYLKIAFDIHEDMH